MAEEIRVEIRDDSDVVVARQRGRDLATEVGFEGTDLTLIATAISEVARNIVSYAKTGEIVLFKTSQRKQTGIVVVAFDRGPGIPNVEEAMRDGFSTGNSLGLGLPGARRLMDEFDIVSRVGYGTTVTMKKWVQ